MSLPVTVQAAYELRQMARIAKVSDHVRKRLHEIADALDPSTTEKAAVPSSDLSSQEPKGLKVSQLRSAGVAGSGDAS